ncbi:hypothetical protein [Actinokineospora enzanensis]|uniref:hypothetical protein n=1 Tax=Actinokineospora enzanensis TaxID=155975 RepID=UPI000378CA7E|nr:hypothetical protein [Actinokineospora enzanensis]
MIWATVDEVRGYRPALPLSGLDDAELGGLIASAVRALVPYVIRWPVVDTDTDRPADDTVRADVVAAVAELVRDRRAATLAETELGGTGAAAVIAAGGSVTAGSLTVSGGRGARVGSTDRPVPRAALDALCSAGMVGGSVPTW